MTTKQQLQRNNFLVEFLKTHEWDYQDLIIHAKNLYYFWQDDSDFRKEYLSMKEFEKRVWQITK